MNAHQLFVSALGVMLHAFVIAIACVAGILALTRRWK